MDSSVQVILLGAPGSGKGTQAKRIASSFEYTHLSTGDLLRSEIAKASELGNRINGLVKSGQLVDDSTVLELLQSNCDLVDKKYIFDGFPRTIEQAKSLDEIVLKDSSYIALHFKIDPKIVIGRLSARRVCSKCGEVYNLMTSAPSKEGICDKCGSEIFQRDDDKEEVIKKRFDVYDDTINAVIDYYKDKGVLKSINADNDFDSVFSEISKILSD